LTCETTAILSKQIIVEDVPVTVVGVTPREFFGLQVGFRPDVWVRLGMEPMVDHRSRVNSCRMSLALVGVNRKG